MNPKGDRRARAHKKRTWGGLKETWTPSDGRDAVVDFLKRMNTLTEIPFQSLLGWCELCPRKFARWRGRYGKANEHNAQVPRDHWLEEDGDSAVLRLTTKETGKRPDEIKFVKIEGKWIPAHVAGNGDDLIMDAILQAKAIAIGFVGAAF